MGPEIKRALVSLHGVDKIAETTLHAIHDDLGLRGQMPLHFFGFMELTKRLDEQFAEAEKRAREAAFAKRKKERLEKQEAELEQDGSVGKNASGLNEEKTSPTNRRRTVSTASA